MDYQNITEAIDSLGESFTSFQKSQLERMNSLEAMLKRPQFQEVEEGPEKKELYDYLRKGEDIQPNTKALSSTTDSGGGVLIPKPVLDKIHTTLKDYSPFRTLARVTQISTDALELLLDKGGHADVGWVAETADRPETDTPELAKLRIPVHQLYAKPKASQKLLDDASVDLEDWLVQKIADRMAEVENQAFVLGDGDNKPKGFLSYPTVALGQGTWGSFEEVRSSQDGVVGNPENLLKVFYALKPQYLRGAVWLMPRSAVSAIRHMKDTTGQFIWQPGLIPGTPSMLLGAPVVICDDMPALVPGTAAKTVAFGNFLEAYQIVDRAEIHVLRDPYSAKPYVEFYSTKRVGGDVINFEAIKILNCAQA